jgi:hypothetical protein
MGYEIKCRTRVTDASGVREADATVLLETDDLIVRGEARVKIPTRDIQDVKARGDKLTVVAPQATVVLTLGADAAAKWAKKIQEPPKQLIDKLDVKPTAKVWLFGVDDETLIAQVNARAEKTTSGSSASACDVVFVGVENDKQLDRIDRATRAMKDDGAIWVVHPKGATGVADTTIFDRAKTLGLTYTKVARVSETHTAEKLVRPVATRKATKKKAS